MDNFIYKNDTKIIFGRDNYNEISKNIKSFLKNKARVLLHYEADGELIKKLGIYEKVISSLKDSNIEFKELGGVVPNPRLSLVYEGIKICIDEGIDKLKDFFKSLGINLKLSDYGITDEHFSLMAEKALGNSETLGRFMQLNKQDIINILNLAK